MSRTHVLAAFMALQVAGLIGWSGSAWSAEPAAQSQATQPPVVATTASQQLAHTVFFTTAEDVPDAARQLVAACRQYLSGHAGTVRFSVGARAAEMQRDVNDRQFTVALFLVFRDKESHDAYQVSPRHQEFIEKYQHLWSNVRVFDSYVEGPLLVAKPKPLMDIRKAVRLPDRAAGFAGMLRGKVVRKSKNLLVIRVLEVARQWEHSKAADAQQLVGNLVSIAGPKAERGQTSAIEQFLATLKVGDEVALDVAHRGGEQLTVVELTEQQRQRVR